MNKRILILTFILLLVILHAGFAGATDKVKECSGSLSAEKSALKQNIIMTVRGAIEPSSLGRALAHEHVMVDFIGADKTGTHRYDANEVIEVMLPYLKELKEREFTGFVDCTPAWLARDVKVLRRVSELSGLYILTNTGYYGAVNDKFLPAHAFSESADELAQRWVGEWEQGIDGTDIRPGFIKTAVDAGTLSDIDRKLVEAAAKTHLRTGLTIACHTGETQAALAVLETVKSNGVHPSALIIVHANGIVDPNARLKIAKAGAWVEYDAVNKDSIGENGKLINEMAQQGLLERVLISHDAGCFFVGEEKGGQTKGKIRPFTVISDKLVPALRAAGLSEAQIDKLLIDNPREAYTVRVRNL